jgi:hypothetical protein
MNNKLIRLTESDLHRIVKESVNRILSEAINELDPRTYASYAQKRQMQGQYDKAQKGKIAAINAFNQQYGKDEYYPNGGQNRYEMIAPSGENNYPYRAETYYEEPNYPRGAAGQTINFAKQGDNIVNHRDGQLGLNYQEYKDNNIFHPYDAIGRKATRVAQQMAKGDGKYIKGKGWE